MVQLTEANKKLKDLQVTEGHLKQLKSLGHAEATWRNSHELKMLIKWAQDRHDLIQAELDRMLPPKPRRVREKNEVPVVSHGSGRPNSGGQMYGERYACEIGGEMASVHLTAYVEGDDPRMTLDLILDCPDVMLHDEDSARTFLYESICDIADDIRESLLLDIG